MRWRNLAAAGLAALSLAGCTVAPERSSLAFDPFEDHNRPVHETNKALDRAVFGPVARDYGRTTPAPVRGAVTDLRNNWLLPGQSVQYVLQGRGGQAMNALGRFAVNTTLGVGGLLDPATEMGLAYRETDIDETFYVWGLPEGGYLELPFIGPGTQRDWTGWVLDQVLDPMYYVLPVEAATTLLAAAGLDVLNDRYALDPVFESLLHESADSYTAQRISYLQNMRARLQGEAELEQLEDIYADF